MSFFRLPNGNLLVPVGFEDGDIQGDAMIEITPDDPEYAEWEPFLGTVWEEPLSERALERLRQRAESSIEHASQGTN
jgi:hypothetical protein